jgi:hypothetical protein
LESIAHHETHQQPKSSEKYISSNIQPNERIEFKIIGRSIYRQINNLLSR